MSTSQLEAIKQTKVDMSVYLGNYAVATDNGAAYQRQRDEIQSAIQTYGTDHIGGVTVGNEFMLKYGHLSKSAHNHLDLPKTVTSMPMAVVVILTAA
jgi:exo-beta-1,3-glucanase (GH17 family)